MPPITNKLSDSTQVLTADTPISTQENQQKSTQKKSVNITQIQNNYINPADTHNETANKSIPLNKRNQTAIKTIAKLFFW